MSSGLNDAAKTVLAHHLSRELGGEANDYTQIVKATNDHITPFFETIIRQAKAEAWDEGYTTGSEDSAVWEDVKNGYRDEYEDTPNPYREADDAER